MDKQWLKPAQFDLWKHRHFYVSSVYFYGKIAIYAIYF